MFPQGERDSLVDTVCCQSHPLTSRQTGYLLIGRFFRLVTDFLRKLCRRLTVAQLCRRTEFRVEESDLDNKQFARVTLAVWGHREK